MNFEFDQFFTEEYARKALLPAVTAGIVAGYSAYTLVNGMTYRKARDKVDDTVNMLVSQQIVPVAQALGVGSTLGMLSGVLISALADVGDYISEAILVIPADKTEADVIAASDAQTVGIVVGLVAGTTAYFGLDALAKFAGVRLSSSNPGGY